MKKQLLLFFLIFHQIYLFTCMGQNPELQKKRANIWCFGYDFSQWDTINYLIQTKILDFNGGTVVSYEAGHALGDEGAATISDSSGNLAFYSAGWLAYNKVHDTLQNSDSLMAQWGGWYSCTQGAIMVPRPGINNEIYFFTNTQIEDNVPLGLRYNVVDMNLDNGNGAIIPTKKNKLLHGPSTEKLCAVHHCNGIDVWVLMHELYSNKFFAYLISNSGIDTIPVISSVGFSHSPAYSSIGSMKFSPNGKKVALVFDQAQDSKPPQLFDFNNLTGEVSNPVTLIKDTVEYGVSFSPNSTKLYISTSDGKLIQYNVSHKDADSIRNSRVLLHHRKYWAIKTIQNGPDGKIYCQTAMLDSLGVINLPNESGLACDFQYYGLYIPGYQGCSALSNFIESYFNQDTTAYPCNNIGINQVNINSTILLSPNPFTDFFTISLDNMEHDFITKLEIYNLNGDLLFEYENLFTKTLTLNTTSWNQGVYIIKCQLKSFKNSLQNDLFSKIIYKL